MLNAKTFGRTFYINLSQHLALCCCFVGNDVFSIKRSDRKVTVGRLIKSSKLEKKDHPNRNIRNEHLVDPSKVLFFRHYVYTVFSCVMVGTWQVP